MPKRERERVRATQVLGAGGEESDEEGEEGQQGAREERRKGGAGGMGGSEMERERVVLGPANGARPNADGNSGESDLFRIVYHCYIIKLTI